MGKVPFTPMETLLAEVNRDKERRDRLMGPAWTVEYATSHGQQRRMRVSKSDAVDDCELVKFMVHKMGVHIDNIISMEEE